MEAQLNHALAQLAFMGVYPDSITPAQIDMEQDRIAARTAKRAKP
jgi:hypothetical protein